MMMMTDVIAP